MFHAKKVKPEYFVALQSGKKRFELRRQEPDEPDYAVDDILVLNEWNEGRYTGRSIQFRVVYVLDAAHSCGCLNGGCVALGLAEATPAASIG